MKRIIAIALTLMLVSLSAFAHPFTDVASHWGESEISAAYDKGIIEGDGTGMFRPDDEISRAEFMKIVTALLANDFEVEIPEKENPAHWADKYYTFALENYLPTNEALSYDGVSPALMDTETYDLPIRRWEMAFILESAFENVFGITGGEAEGITDIEAIKATYDESIAASIESLVAFGISNGDEDGNFNAGDKGTRAEAVALINRSSAVMDSVMEYYESVAKQEDEYQAQLEAGIKTYEEIPKGHPVVEFKMSNGKAFEITLYPEYAPQTCANFLALVKDNFYDGLTFHRIIEGFMAQGGDPAGDGTGGAEHTIKGEFSANGFSDNTLKHEKGVVSMARSQHPNSASSQFFICYDTAAHLDGSYAAFGKVTKGMRVVEEFLNAELEENQMGELASPKTPIVIKSARVKTSR